MSITGGIDWQTMAVPLLEVGPLLMLVFVMYIFFMVLGVLNVVVGHFVDNARKASQSDRELIVKGEMKQQEEYLTKMRTIFNDADGDENGMLTWDEFEKYFSGDQVPKLLLTTQKKPSSKLFDFMKELIHVIPNTFYYPRKEFTFKKICKEAGERGFTDIILFHEKAKQVQGMYICHLPNGPTSYWRLTRLKLGQEMKGSATCNATHNPELILNNFVTRLGRRVGRQLLALFPQKPDFVGRRTVTFHNQRDFVFFRHYRYVFKDDGSKCRLQEIGPRFTLKCKYVQHGTFNSKAGEYEYIWRPDSQVSRKRFFI